MEYKEKMDQVFQDETRFNPKQKKVYEKVKNVHREVAPKSKDLPNRHTDGGTAMEVDDVETHKGTAKKLSTGQEIQIEEFITTNAQTMNDFFRRANLPQVFQLSVIIITLISSSRFMHS